MFRNGLIFIGSAVRSLVNSKNYLHNPLKSSPLSQKCSTFIIVYTFRPSVYNGQLYYCTFAHIMCLYNVQFVRLIHFTVKFLLSINSLEKGNENRFSLHDWAKTQNLNEPIRFNCTAQFILTRIFLSVHSKLKKNFTQIKNGKIKIDFIEDNTCALFSICFRYSFILLPS